MENFNYEFISFEDKLKIAEAQLRELESAHFSLMMIEPSKITDSQAYRQWVQQKMVVEKQINLLRLKRNEVSEFSNIAVPVVSYEEE
jgi:hypothetical protein